MDAIGGRDHPTGHDTLQRVGRVEGESSPSLAPPLTVMPSGLMMIGIVPVEVLVTVILTVKKPSAVAGSDEGLTESAIGLSAAIPISDW